MWWIIDRRSRPFGRSYKALQAGGGRYADEEKTGMRKILHTAVAVVTFAATAVYADVAAAMTPMTQSALRDAAARADSVQSVRWICRYDWRGFRRCWWTTRPYYRMHGWHYGYPPPYWRRHYYY